MRSVRTRVTALLVAAVAIVTLGASPASACTVNQTQFPYVLSTGASAGTADPIGALDTEWLIVGAPAPVGITIPGPVFSVARHPFWVEPRPVANWINPATVINPTAPVGFYTFRTTFFVPPGMTVDSLSFRYASDNSIDFFLNSGFIGGFGSSTASYSQWHSLFLANPALGQVNTLEARVYNDGGPFGFVLVGGANLCV